MKQLNHFDRIYDYAEGQMDAGQQAAFEAELSANAGLRAEYDAFLASQKAMEFLAFDELGNMAKDVKPVAKVIPIWQRAWARAAAILLLLGIGLFWYANKEYKNEALVASYFMEPNLSPTRSEVDQRPSNLAATAFELSDLKEAIQLASSVPADSADYEDAQYVLGHAYFKNNQPGLAVSAFEKVTERSGDFESALYNRALAFIKMGEIAAAKKILSEMAENDNYSKQERASRLLKQLDSPLRCLMF